MQAAVGCAQLDKISTFIEKRKKNWEYLYTKLADYQDVLILPKASLNSEPSWFGFILSVKPESGLKRNSITRFLENHNIQTRLLFSGNLTKHPCFDEYRNTSAYRIVGNLEKTDYVMNNSFWVGVYPGMTDQKLDYIADCIIEAITSEKY